MAVIGAPAMMRAGNCPPAGKGIIFFIALFRMPFNGYKNFMLIHNKVQLVRPAALPCGCFFRGDGFCECHLVCRIIEAGW